MVDMENDLIAKCKKGDLNSLETLISNYSNKVYNILLRILGNEEDAKDVSQEVFIKVYKKITTFNGQSQFSTWLYRVAVNSARDLIKKRKVNMKHEDKNVDETKIARLDSDPSLIYESKEKSYMVLKGINLLNNEQREIIVLRDIQGFSYDEISVILGISIGTVKSRLNRSRLRLRDILMPKVDAL